ncbi:MAG: hypothetical protein CMM90_06075 [Rickettsiales bacterium]|nr:hypothetical protein [Rickettsiales bacterium]|tara:strand:+ start:49 stop:567 length:519 start_codon:yes stop_codon:yes gene_type:complete
MRLFFLLLTLTLLSCANDMNLKNFENETPKFVLEDYFDGKTKAWGMFHDRFGNLKRSFKVDITGTIDNDTLTLDEKFIYNDGEKESRIWSIKILGNNKYSGTADDVIGEATGISSGNALNWKYKLNLKVKESTVAVDFDDWMFLQDDNILMNRAEVKKWGIVLGVVSITFKK